MSYFSTRVPTSHGMRNELHFWLKWLHRGVQYSRFFLESDQNYLCLLETQEEWRMLSCSFTDEVQLVAHPVGLSLPARSISMGISNLRQGSNERDSSSPTERVSPVI